MASILDTVVGFVVVVGDGLLLLVVGRVVIVTDTDGVVIADEPLMVVVVLSHWLKPAGIRLVKRVPLEQDM